MQLKKNSRPRRRVTSFLLTYVDTTRNWEEILKPKSEAFCKSRNERQRTRADFNEYVNHQRKGDNEEEIIGKELIRPPSCWAWFVRPVRVFCVL
jgi:hypothetical protein